MHPLNHQYQAPLSTGLGGAYVWNSFFGSFLSKIKQDQALLSHVHGNIWTRRTQFWLGSLDFNSTLKVTFLGTLFLRSSAYLGWEEWGWQIWSKWWTCSFEPTRLLSVGIQIIQPVCNGALRVLGLLLADGVPWAGFLACRPGSPYENERNSGRKSLKINRQVSNRRYRRRLQTGPDEIRAIKRVFGSKAEFLG